MSLGYTGLPLSESHPVFIESYLPTVLFIERIVIIYLVIPHFGIDIYCSAFQFSYYNLSRKLF